MSTDNPLVSTVIPTHNRADLLQRALTSVIKQTYMPLAIIVVDDGSTDNTYEVVQQLQKKNDITYLKNETAQGAPAARNKGVEAASGTFIAGLDDDDEWHKERIAELVAAESGEFSFITSDVDMVYTKKQTVWEKKKLIDLQTLLFTNQVGNQALVRRDRFLAVGGFDPDLAAAQDYDLWIRLCAQYGPVKNVQKTLQTTYMDHDADRITDQPFEGYLQFYKKHKKRFNRKQRKYQLYKIRRAQGKREKLTGFFSCVPYWRYFKEVKRIIADWLWK